MFNVGCSMFTFPGGNIEHPTSNAERRTINRGAPLALISAAAAERQGWQRQAEHEQGGRLGNGADDDVVIVDGLTRAIAVNDEPHSEEGLCQGHIESLGSKGLIDGTRKHLPTGQLR